MIMDFFYLFIPNLPLLFKTYKAKLENLMGHALVGHLHESSAAQNRVSVAVEIEISSP